MLYFKIFLFINLFVFFLHVLDPAHKFMLGIDWWITLQHINNYRSKYRPFIIS
jgi:hypothetical protein